MVCSLLQVLDLIAVGHQGGLVDGVPAGQHLIVQSYTQITQTQTLLKGEVQHLHTREQVVEEVLREVLVGLEEEVEVD